MQHTNIYDYSSQLGTAIALLPILQARSYHLKQQSAWEMEAKFLLLGSILSSRDRRLSICDRGL